MATRARRTTKKTPTKAAAKVEPKAEAELKKTEETKENGDVKEETKTEEEVEAQEVDEETEKELLEGEEEEAEGAEEAEEEEEEGEKEEKDIKKEEKEDDKKKQNQERKNKTYIPSAGKYNQDEHVYMRLRSVVVGPLELDDLEGEIVKDMVSKAEEFFYRFHYIEKEEKHVGHIEFRFKSIPEADEMIETLKTVKEGVVVKRLIGGMNAAKFDKDVRGINDDSEKEKYKRIVAVGGVPETATVEKLQEVFPDARVKFIALKPDGTPKWYAYLELDDEDGAKKYAEEHKEVEFEGEKLYCRCLRPGKPEESELERDPDHVMTDEERKKLQARINTMKFKLNGGAVLRPQDAQRLRRRVSKFQSLLRAHAKKRAQMSGDNKPANVTTTPKTPKQTPNKRMGSTGPMRTGGNMRGGRGGGMRGGRGGQMMRTGGRWQGQGQGGPNRNMGGSGFQGNQRMQNMGQMGSPRQQQNWGGNRGGGNQGQGQGGQGQGQGRSNMYNNPRQTANAVNMLVGLTNLLSQARNQGGNQGGQRGPGNQGGGDFGNQGGNQGGNFGGGMDYNQNRNFNQGGGNFNQGGGNYNNDGNFGNQQGGGFGGNQGGNFNQGGGNFNQGGGNFGNQGGNFGGFNRKRTFQGNRRGGGPQAKQGRRFGNNWN